MRGFSWGSLCKKGTIIFLILLLLFNQLIIPVSAERVYGRGSVHSGYSSGRQNNYPDTTIIPPLGFSWHYETTSAAPLDKGITLTNYRIYFGDGRNLNGFSDQREMQKIDFNATQKFAVGNPFQLSYSSSYGTVTTSLEQYNDSQQDAFFFGTSDGRIGRLFGFTLNHANGQQGLGMSSQIPAMGAIREIIQNGDFKRVLAASDTQLVNYDVINDKAVWWYYLRDKTATPGRYSGITNFTLNADYSNANHSIVVTDNGLDEGWGLIFMEVNGSSRTGWQKANYEIRYNAGIPKHVAFDPVSRLIYTIDREGRFYVHNTEGVLQHGTFFYAGDHTTRGYDSVGGVMLSDNYAFVSTKGSSYSLTNRGSITRFNKSNPSIKSVYVHESAITTTPYMVSGLVYFGDENGKIWALNPNTMQLVNWYLDENLSTPRAWYDVGSAVNYILGADNHMIASTATTIDGFKGRPDFVVNSIKDSSNADLNGKRYNFTTSPSEISFTNHILNKGTFDYHIYDDFLGTNHQHTTFGIRNIDSNTTLPINTANITASNVAPSPYQSNTEPNNPQAFQIGAGLTATQSYRFTPPTEGKYTITVNSDSAAEQKEFDETNNSKSATVDVVDMRNPSVSSNKTYYRPNEQVNFSLSKTQLYSYSNYSFQVVSPSGTSVHTSSGSAFTSTQSTSNTSQLGTYQYKLDITNRYGDVLTSGWKNFTVGNNPPTANFTTDKSSYYIDQSILVTNAASDIDGDPVTVSYVVTQPNGTTLNYSTANPTITNLQRGTYSIKQTAVDSYGATDTLTKTVTVVNRDPVAGFNTNKTSYYNDETVSVTSTATDPDNDPLSYQYIITKPDGSTFSSTVANPTFNSLQIGSYTIKQTVNDGYGGTATITKSITVNNRPPIAGFVTSKDKYKDNETISISSTASDPDGHSVSHLYEITRPDGTKFSSTAANPSFGSLQVGTYTIKQTVTDPYNASATISKTVVVEESNLPPVAGFVFDKTKYYKGEYIQITSTATDPNGDVLSYNYEITRPDGTKFTSTDVNPRFQATLTGTYSVKQVVRDPQGLSDTITKNQWVQTLPTPGFTTNKTSYYKNESVAVTTSAFDEDGGTVTHSYEITDPKGNKRTFTDANPSIPLYTEVGTYSIKQVVTDDEGDSASVTKTITVVNRPPVAGFTFNKTSYIKGDTIQITNGASDPDGDQLTFSYTVTKPSGAKLSFSTASPSFIGDEKGTYSVVQTVTDVNGATASVTNTTVVINRPPVADFSFSPSTIYNDTNVSFTNRSSDPDGDALTYSWSYQEPGTTTWVQFSTAQHPTKVLNIKGVWSIKLVVTDTSGAQATAIKSPTVSNRPPVASFTYSPTTIYDSTNVTFTDASTDADNDVLSYQWAYQEPNSTIWTNFSTSKNPSRVLNKVGTWGIRLTVTDTSGATSTKIQNPVVLNRPPSVTLTYTPSTVFEGDTVNLCARPTDPDNHVMTLKLFVKKGNESEVNVLTVSNAMSGVSTCYSFVADNARYDIRAEVSDGIDSASTSTWIQVNPLIIKGYVKHTSDWEQKHLEQGHPASQFYSGETFILEADVSNYPIEYVKSTLNNALLSNQTIYTKSVPLSYLRPLVFGGELYEEIFQEPNTSLTQGTKDFIFEVKYSNGVIKQDKVQIQIIGDVLYDGFQFHRRY